MLTVLTLLRFGAAPAATVPPSRDGVLRPRVEVRTDRGDGVFARGEVARVHFRTDADAYVTLLRVDTDGRVRILFPSEPGQDNFARGGLDYEVQGNSSDAGFFVDDYPGVGYLFAVAAADPFIYDAIAAGDQWDYQTIADGRVRGDPYVALTDLARRIVPSGYDAWDYDIVPYYVQQHYDYPRFLCYDCHSYASYPSWDPYDYSCVRFRIVVFDDPYYYPYRSYGSRQVVFTRPYRPEPRFIFKDRGGSDAFITRVPERAVNPEGRRDIGVRSRDLGTPGTVPVPISRRSAPSGRGPTAGDRPIDERARRTDAVPTPTWSRRPETPIAPARPEPGRAQPDRRERWVPDAPATPRLAPSQPPAVRSESPRFMPPVRAEPQREPAPRPRYEAPEAPHPEPRVESRPEAPPRDPPRTSEPELRRRKP